MSNSPFDCIGKVGFETRKLALQVSQRVGKKARKERKAYFCRLCGKWHLGNYYLGNPKKPIPTGVPFQ